MAIEKNENIMKMAMLSGLSYEIIEALIEDVNTAEDDAKADKIAGFQWEMPAGAGKEADHEEFLALLEAEIGGDEDPKDEDPQDEDPTDEDPQDEDPTEEPVEPAEDPIEPAEDPTEEPVEPAEDPVEPAEDPTEEPIEPAEDPTTESETV